jgi:hypothetical protein
MSRTLADARQQFVAAIQRDTPGPDLPRLVKVLDALIAWSVARPDQLAFRADEGRSEVISFSLTGTKVVFWSAQVTRGAGPKLEIYPPTGRALSAEERTTVLETLNAHSREALVEGDRLRIGFGALKNDAARTAVLALMTQLLATSAQASESLRAGAKAASS